LLVSSWHSLLCFQTAPARSRFLLRGQIPLDESISVARARRH
jgi:hypothetical protein